MPITRNKYTQSLFRTMQPYTAMNNTCTETMQPLHNNYTKTVQDFFKGVQGGQGGCFSVCIAPTQFLYKIFTIRHMYSNTLHNFSTELIQLSSVMQIPHTCLDWADNKPWPVQDLLILSSVLSKYRTNIYKSVAFLPHYVINLKII